MSEAKNGGILFQEVQRFRNPYVWTFLMGGTSVAVGTLVWVGVRQIFLERPVGGTPFPVAALAALGGTVILLNLAVLIYFLMMKLQTEVANGGLYVRMAPLQRKVRQIDLQGATKIEAVVCRPIAEFSGYGVRRRRNATAYLVHGNSAVRLEYENGCSVIIGTQRPEALRDALKAVV